MVCCWGVDRSPCFEASVAKAGWSCGMWGILGKTVTPKQCLTEDRAPTYQGEKRAHLQQVFHIIRGWSGAWKT